MKDKDSRKKEMKESGILMFLNEETLKKAVLFVFIYKELWGKMQQEHSKNTENVFFFFFFFFWSGT